MAAFDTAAADCNSWTGPQLLVHSNLSPIILDPLLLVSDRKATSHPSQEPSAEVLREAEAAIPLRIVNEEALVPSPIPLEQRGALTLTPKLARLPVELDVAVPVRDFRVRNLLALEPGAGD